MIGSRTNKILNYSVRCKHCRVCEHAKRRRKRARVHRCPKNWSGSSKAMEPSMGVELSKKLAGETEIENEGETKSVQYSLGTLFKKFPLINMLTFFVFSLLLGPEN